LDLVHDLPTSGRRLHYPESDFVLFLAADTAHQHDPAIVSVDAYRQHAVEAARALGIIPALAM
jgi:hypothetical protein